MAKKKATKKNPPNRVRTLPEPSLKALDTVLIEAGSPSGWTAARGRVGLDELAATDTLARAKLIKKGPKGKVYRLTKRGEVKLAELPEEAWHLARNPRTRQSGVTKGGSAGKYIKYENRIRKMTARQLDAEQAKMRDSIDEEKLKILEMELYMRRAWNPARRRAFMGALGYDARASSSVNLRNLAAKRAQLEEELLVTRDATAKTQINSALKKIAAVEKRLHRSATATAKRKPPKRPAPQSAAAKKREKRTGKVARHFEQNPTSKEAGNRLEKEAQLRIRQWVRSKDRAVPDYVSLMEAYDSSRLAAANFSLTEDDEDKAGRKRMITVAKQLRKEIVIVMEGCGGAPISPIETEFISRSKREPSERFSDKFPPPGAGTPESKSFFGDKEKQPPPPKSFLSRLVGNPTSMRHLKTGRAALKKSEKAWDNYYKRGSKKSLLEAYELLLLAKTELKYGGDTAGSRQANAGLKLARVEMKSGLS